MARLVPHWLLRAALATAWPGWTAVRLRWLSAVPAAAWWSESAAPEAPLSGHLDCFFC